MEDLTNVVTSALEARGVLGKIRAELRASVFSAVYEQQGGPGPEVEQVVSNLTSDAAGQMALQLVHELLSHCALDFSLAVFQPEAGVAPGAADRTGLAAKLGIDAGAADEPLLVTLLRRTALTGGAALAAPAAGATARGAEATSDIADRAASLGAERRARQAAAASATTAGRGSGPGLSISAAVAAGSSSSPPGGSPSGSPSEGGGGARPAGGGGMLGALPPLSGRRQQPMLGDLPPLGGKDAGGGPTSEDRLDSLESKLAGIAGLPSSTSPPKGAGKPSLGADRPRAGSVEGDATTLKLPRPDPLPCAVTDRSIVSGASATGGATLTSLGHSADFEDEIDEELIEESFELDEDDDEFEDDELEMGGGSAGFGGRGLQSMDESLSPARAANMLRGFDHTEAVELPK